MFFYVPSRRLILLRLRCLLPPPWLRVAFAGIKSLLFWLENVVRRCMRLKGKLFRKQKASNVHVSFLKFRKKSSWVFLQKWRSELQEARNSGLNSAVLISITISFVDFAPYSDIKKSVFSDKCSGNTDSTTFQSRDLRSHISSEIQIRTKMRKGYLKIHKHLLWSSRCGLWLGA